MAASRAKSRDEEAKVFHALALLAICRAAIRRCRCGKQAGAIAENVFARNPQHPGAPHYILHAYDMGPWRQVRCRRPRLREDCARLESRAPHAAHAFLQLG